MNVRDASWVAGVLDAGLNVYFRTRERDEIYAVDVFMPATPDVAEFLIETIGGKYNKDRKMYYIPARTQREVLNRVLPWLRSAPLRSKILRTLIFRETQANGKVSPEVKELRKKLGSGVDDES